MEDTAIVSVSQEHWKRIYYGMWK